MPTCRSRSSVHPVTASAAHTHREDADNAASRSNAFAAFRPIARMLTRIDLATSAGDRQADLSRAAAFPVVAGEECAHGLARVGVRSSDAAARAARNRHNKSLSHSSRRLKL